MTDLLGELPYCHSMRGWIFLFFLSFSFPALGQDADFFSIAVMGDLVVGDIQNPHSEASAQAWEQLEGRARYLKSIGVDAISADFWWGAIEYESGKFNWDYVHKYLDVMEKAGMKVAAVLSTHQLGGNIGDFGYIPIPRHAWTEFIGQPGVVDENSLKYKSQYGNYSEEVISPWGMKIASPMIERFWRAFHEEFKGRASLFSEINLSMGPASELRHPAFNAHDPVSYPGPGSLQMYSELAIADFQEYVKAKYGTIEAVNKAWNFQLKSFAEVQPPHPDHVATTFFSSGEHFSAYGKDLFDWYNQSLVKHGDLLIGLAKKIFWASDSPFVNTSLGGKESGIHWRVGSDRLAELTAGLIRTSYADWNSPESSYGYRDILQVFQRAGYSPTQAPFAFHFTAIEMNNGHDANMGAESKAEDLVFKMGNAANEMGIYLKGENALGFEMQNPKAWDNIRNVMIWSFYKGFTFLRIGEFFVNPVAEQGTATRHLIDLIKFRDSQRSERAAVFCKDIY